MFIFSVNFQEKLDEKNLNKCCIFFLRTKLNATTYKLNSETCTVIKWYLN